ncbi:MAG: HDIG domain-containing metalloprotein [Nannocystaceae bacterium]
MSTPPRPSPQLAEQLLVPAIELGRTGVEPPADVSLQVRQHASEIRSLEPTRLRLQLEAAICGHHPHLALQWIRDAGLLIEILPELDATVAFSQEGGRRHKDVWEHTKTVVLQAVPRPAVRWAALLHDIGKVPTRRFTSDGKVTFLGHAGEGARMFRRRVSRRFSFGPELKRCIEALILHHLRAGQYDGGWTDSAVRRFAREMGPLLEDLLALSRADITSKRPGKRAQCLQQISALSVRVCELEEADAKVKPLPPGLGNVLMRAFALPPGKHLAHLRQRLEHAHDAGSLEAGQEAEYYISFVREHELLVGLQIEPQRARHVVVADESGG